jgi:hypothetical protein
MKFYGNGIVWDKESNRNLCEFKDGELSTDDTRVMEILISLGYQNDGVVEEIIKEVEAIELSESSPVIRASIGKSGKSK